MNSRTQHISEPRELFTARINYSDDVKAISHEDLKFELTSDETMVPQIHPSVLATCSALMLINVVIGTPANTLICVAVASSK